ncbi:hypothetical protein [Lacinutrix himadriensis]|uniref:hypothetical protein n=1 Tax=Lacinutrix himadriensis TaxID=641549 RepID=UPI000B21B5AA|nr:hypothetical protein [Lacinutrix himadriensis]
MKKAWSICKEYYVTYLVMAFVFMLFFYFSSKSPSDLERFKFLAIFISIFLVLIATAEYLSHTYYRPWKINKMLVSDPFLKFSKKGFTTNKIENTLIGEIEKYTILMGILWTNDLKMPVYFYQVLFNPYQRSQYIQEKEYDTYQKELKKEGQVIKLNSIVKEYNRNKLFINTSYEKMHQDIMDSIIFLKEKNLDSISFDDWEALIPEIEKYGRSLQKI